MPSLCHLHTDDLCTSISSLLSNVNLTSMFNIYSISQTKPLIFFLKLDPLSGFLSTVKGTTIHCFYMSKTLESPLTHPLPRVSPSSPLDFIYFIALVLYSIYSTTTTTSQLPSRYSAFGLSQEPSNGPSATNKLLTLLPLSPVTAYSSFLDHLSFPWGSLPYLVYCSYKFLLYYAPMPL